MKEKREKAIKKYIEKFGELPKLNLMGGVTTEQLIDMIDKSLETGEKITMKPMRVPKDAVV